ncbi:hypothetical protein [Marinilactibacillus piezotolerans]|uniref:hypothetical protein n=1 Tax=Marinilactibacillus piezotolerans TaxID=258723 RepID=UPI0009AF4F4E|nr:hypothetical protein [Marinilactibacillus piezotolerans]
MVEFIVLILFLVILLGGFYLLFGLFMRWILKVQERTITKRIASGKIDDEKLRRYYKSSKNNNTTILMNILVYGPFYKYGKQQYEQMNRLYKEEMIKRDLLDESHVDIPEF